VGRYWLDMASTVFVSTSINFLGSRSELPRQSTALPGMAPCPTGAFGEVPFFQFVNTYNRAGRSPWR